MALAIAITGVAGCYEAPYQSTFPEPQASWQGPPGGEIDPSWGAQPAPEAPGYPGYPAGYPDGSYPPGDGTPVQPSGDPADPGYVMGDVTDAEIDTTLAPYGQWVETDEYGRVWRPDVTIVGGDFTPYETDGSWLYTDYGWTFTCGWDWGWLPFHYGRWAYLDDAYWGWVPDYTWGAAWVEWRHGGDYVGWRPLEPNPRDHRTGVTGRGDHRPNVRDHRTHADDHWRFTTTSNLGNPRLHDHLVPARSALAATSIVTRPPVRAPLHGSAAAVMRGRLDARLRTSQGRTFQPSAGAVRGTSYAPPPRGSYNPPSRYPSTGYNPPARSYNPPTRYPSRGTYNPPSRYPSMGYNPPARSYNPPTRYPSSGSYAPPSRSPSTGYTPPARSYNPPARSYGGSSSYSPPSRSSSSGSSYSPPSRSSGSTSSSHASGSHDHRR